MAGLLYYAPGGPGAMDLEKAQQLGLGYAFDDKVTGRGVQDGPAGQSGVICGDHTRIDPAQIGYWPTKQRWRTIPGTDLWVGRWTDEPVLPSDLVRSKPLPGHWVELADGHRWLVPAVRLAGELDGSVALVEALPREMDLDDSGALVAGQIVAEYRGIYQAACRYFDAMLAAAKAAEEEGRETVSVAIDDQDAITVLGGNYRVGVAEVVLLGLLRINSTHAREILDASIDLPGFIAIKKKLASATASTGSGPQDVPADTDRPSPTSGH